MCNFNFRPFGDRGGGLIAGYNGECVEPPENAEIQLDDQEEEEEEKPKTKGESYQSLEGLISRSYLV